MFVPHQSSLVKKLKSAMVEDPVDPDLAKTAMCELIGTEEEPLASNFFSVLELMHREYISEIQRLTHSLEENRGIKATKLALIFKQHKHLIEDFTVEPDEKDRPKLFYKGDDSTFLMYKAFNNLKVDLAHYIGYKEINHETMCHAIMTAKDFIEREESDIIESMVDAVVIERAHFLLNSRKDKNKITIPEIRKSFSQDLKISTKQIEQILVNAGWKIVKFGTCATKFFTYEN